ncbi:MAG: cell division protein FtsZ [Selenomonas massiliensis]
MPAAEIIKPKITIKVVGVGGGGNNIVRCVREKYDLDMTLIGINSDLRQLNTLHKQGIMVLPVGEKLTNGRGTGGRVEIAEQAARDEEKAIRGMITGSDLVIIAATMGGGFGTGAAPVVAEIAQDMGILTIGVVTTPFHFEMARKMQTAQAGIAQMEGHTDAFITIRNDNLLKIAPDRTMSFVDAFALADEVLRQTVGCVAELILTTGVINVDFADVTTIFRQSPSSDALLAIGVAETPQKAVQRAVESPLLDRDVVGARGVVLNLTGDPTMSLRDVDEAVHYIRKSAHPEVNVIVGLVVQEEMAGKVQATLIATDFDDTYIPASEG